MDIVTHVVDGLINQVNDADPQAAQERVSGLRQKYAEASDDDLAEVTIRDKCFRAGSIGVVTSGAGIVPGVGTIATLTFGVAADVSLTFKLHAELVLEMAAIYDYELTPNEKRTAILAVTGISAGSDKMLQMAGESIAKEAMERLARKSMAEAIPFLGVAVAGGTNILTTYLIGRRAQAYFRAGEEAVQDWSDGLRALSGVDERKLVSWLTETTYNSWELMSRGMQISGNSVVVAGKSTGKVLAFGANFASQSVAQTADTVSTTITTSTARASTYMVDLWQQWRAPDDTQEDGVMRDVHQTVETSDARPSHFTTWMTRWLKSGEMPSEATLETAKIQVSDLTVELVEEKTTVIGTIGIDDDAALSTSNTGQLNVSKYLPDFSWWNGREPAIVQAKEDESTVSLVLDTEPDAALSKPNMIQRILSQLYNFVCKLLRCKPLP